MAKKLCVACGKEFSPRPQIRNQSFCSAPECQRERHRQWQKRKRQVDATYRKVDAEYSSAWAAKNAGYWERYRENHPDYADRNRRQQKQRNAKSQKLNVAIQNPVPPGITSRWSPVKRDRSSCSKRRSPNRSKMAEMVPLHWRSIASTWPSVNSKSLSITPRSLPFRTTARNFCTARATPSFSPVPPNLRNRVKEP